MKDTNPDHYKVGGADFIKFMDDPQIKGFGDWMFANGFNTGKLSVNRWVSVKDGLPKEHPSIFAKMYGTEKWTSGMWRTESDRVLVTIKFPDNTRTVDKGKLQDGAWRTGVSPVLPQEVTHWAVWPEPAEEEEAL